MQLGIHCYCPANHVTVAITVGSVRTYWRICVALLAIQAHFKDKPTNFSGTTLIIALILEISIKISMDFMIDRLLLSFHDSGRGCICSNHNSALLLTHKKDLQSKI